MSAGLQQTFTVPPAGLASEPYGVRYQIWLMVPTTDTYRQAVYADDGFILNGPGLSLSNTAARDAITTEASTALTLTPGAIYNFGLTYLNYSAATTSTIQLLWRRVGGALEVVPREAIHARGRRDYYSFGGAVVAMKEGVMSSATRTLNYLHGDHLGSASLTTNISGTVVSQQRYKPYGEVRWSSGAGMPTDFTFTSQRAGPANYVGSLMDYNARFFSPALGRFVSADTIVPGAGNPQAYNRYMYVRGNPLRYVDPSGHMDASPDDNGATPGIDDWPCGIENDCQMDWNNNAASRFGAGVLDEIGDALKGFFGLASAAANPASVIAAGFRAGSDFGANVASNGWESAISDALDDNPFIGAMRSGDYAYAGGRFVGFVSTIGFAGEFAPKGVCSFSPDTPVATEAGLIPIAGVITGTRVLAWDETANATGYYPVTNVWVHWDPVLVVLVIDGETITTTPEHPFYTPMHGWLPAGELWVGAGLRRADGGAAIVESAMTVTRTELMWNLTVDVAHTFFVGGGEWLVHNTGTGCPVIGTSQETLDLAHGRASRAMAQSMSKSSEFSTVFLDTSSVRIGETSGLNVSTNIMPDVTGLRPDGSWHMVEFLSRGQSWKGMIAKLERLVSELDFKGVLTTWEIRRP